MAYADIAAIRRDIATRAKTPSVRLATADKLETNPNVPAVFVLDYTLETIARPGSKIESKLTVRGVALVGKPGTYKDALATLDTIVGELRAAFDDGIKCGQPAAIVSDSRLDSVDSGLVYWDEKQWPGAQLEWIVFLNEDVDRSA